jgi:hypothetical protein
MTFTYDNFMNLTSQLDSTRALWHSSRSRLDGIEGDSNRVEGLIQGGKEFASNLLKSVGGRDRRNPTEELDEKHVELSSTSSSRKKKPPRRGHREAASSGDDHEPKNKVKDIASFLRSVGRRDSERKEEWGVSQGPNPASRENKKSDFRLGLRRRKHGRGTNTGLPDVQLSFPFALPNLSRDHSLFSFPNSLIMVNDGNGSSSPKSTGRVLDPDSPRSQKLLAGFHPSSEYSEDLHRLSRWDHVTAECNKSARGRRSYSCPSFQQSGLMNEFYSRKRAHSTTFTSCHRFINTPYLLSQKSRLLSDTPQAQFANLIEAQSILLRKLHELEVHSNQNCMIC